MKIRTMLLFSAAALLTVPAMAAQHNMGGKMAMRHGMMAEADANKDGAIDKAEFDAEAAAKFADADTNKDGVISKEEMAAHWERERERRRQEMQDQMFQRMDTNGDGKISAEEHNATAAQMFQMMDRNKDGQLSPDDRPKDRDRKGGQGMMPPGMPEDE